MALPRTHNGRAVLVADDDDLVSDVVAMTLEAHGYRVTQAPHGLIAATDQIDAQLVILDANVPGSDFVETLALLRERSIPVLVLSGEIVPPPGVNSRDFLAKPVDLGDLLATVQRMTSTGSGD